MEKVEVKNKEETTPEFDESQYIKDIEEDPTEDFIDPEPQLVDIDLDSTDWNAVAKGDAVYIEKEDGSF